MPLRWRGTAAGTACRRRFDQAQLLSGRADLLHLENFADRRRESGAFGNQNLARLKEGREAIGFGRRQAQHGAVVEQRS